MVHDVRHKLRDRYSKKLADSIVTEVKPEFGSLHDPSNMVHSVIQSKTVYATQEDMMNWIMRLIFRNNKGKTKSAF